MARRSLGLCALLAMACAPSSPSSPPTSAGADARSKPPSGAQIGKVAPPFSRPLLDGSGTTSIGGELPGPTKHRATLVIFFATWSSPDMMAIAKIAEVARRHPEAAFVAVGLDDDDHSLLSAVQSYGGAHLPLVWDEHHDIAQRFGVDVTPKLFVLDADNVVRFVHGGYRGGEGFEVDIEISDLLGKDICARDTGPADNGETCFRHCDRLAKSSCAPGVSARCRAECRASNRYRNEALSACRASSASKLPPRVPSTEQERDACKELCHLHDYALGTCAYQSGKEPELLAECQQVCGERCWPICER